FAYDRIRVELDLDHVRLSPTAGGRAGRCENVVGHRDGRERTEGDGRAVLPSAAAAAAHGAAAARVAAAAARVAAARAAHHATDAYLPAHPAGAAADGSAG